MNTKKKKKKTFFLKRPGATVAGAAGLRGAGLRLPGRRWRGAGVADVDVVHRRPVSGVPAVHHHGHRRRPPPRTRHLARARRRTPRPLHRRLRPRRLAYYRVLPSFPYKYRFSQVLPRLTAIPKVSKGFSKVVMVFTWFYLVLPSFTYFC